MTVSVKAETQILLGLIALFSIGVAVSLWRDQPSVITAIGASLMVTACLYRFLRRVEGSRLAVASFKAGGSAAVFGAALWFVNGELLSLNPPISPAPTEWIAIDRTGKPFEVRIGQTAIPANTNLLRTYVILVSRAAHNDPSQAPWADFGFAELELGVPLAGESIGPLSRPSLTAPSACGASHDFATSRSDHPPASDSRRIHVFSHARGPAHSEALGKERRPQAGAMANPSRWTIARSRLSASRRRR
ncbi:MAG: hypothetical protein OXE73_03640 [Gammaproteobacteria bacterium]|nr:hypothetical protein [Gammaproteobacteria bacterium]